MPAATYPSSCLCLGFFFPYPLLIVIRQPLVSHVSLNAQDPATTQRQTADSLPANQPAHHLCILDAGTMLPSPHHPSVFWAPPSLRNSRPLIRGLISQIHQYPLYHSISPSITHGAPYRSITLNALQCSRPSASSVCQVYLSISALSLENPHEICLQGGVVVLSSLACHLTLVLSGTDPRLLGTHSRSFNRPPRGAKCRSLALVLYMSQLIDRSAGCWVSHFDHQRKNVNEKKKLTINLLTTPSRSNEFFSSSFSCFVTPSIHNPPEANSPLHAWFSMTLSFVVRSMYMSLDTFCRRKSLYSGSSNYF